MSALPTCSNALKGVVTDPMTLGHLPVRPAPRAMSTQHPDNVAVPIFANGAVLSVDDEVKEAYNAFVHLVYDE
jgi:hypothetical protein